MIKTSLKIIIAAAVGLSIGLAVRAALAQPAPVDRTDPQGYNYTCPEGQEPIGGGACRITPTGCPFGDSVPLDKCEPGPELECNADWTECHMKEEYKGDGSQKVSQKPKNQGGSSCSASQ